MSYANKSTPPRTLTKDEQTRLLKLTGARSETFDDHMVFALALGTGLRVKEIAMLDMADVFNTRGAARQRVTLRWFKFCERDGHKGAPQEVFVSGALRGKLDRFRAWKRKRQQSTADDAPLFVATTGNRLSSRRLRERFARWRGRAELAQQLTFHSLRHTFCQRLYESTGDLLLVQRAARHTSVTTTTIYAQPSTDALVSAIGGLDV
jgi:site-specific recombinase XerC